MSDKAVPTKDDVVAFVENETIFDSQEHRKVILELVTNYTNDVRKKQLLSILEHPVFVWRGFQVHEEGPGNNIFITLVLIISLRFEEILQEIFN